MSTGAVDYREIEIADMARKLVEAANGLSRDPLIKGAALRVAAGIFDQAAGAQAALTIYHKNLR